MAAVTANMWVSFASARRLGTISGDRAIYRVPQPNRAGGSPAQTEKDRAMARHDDHARRADGGRVVSSRRERMTPNEQLAMTSK